MPSSDFSPDQSSNLEERWRVVQLSQRDVALQVPINYVTQPGVSLSAVCFGNKVYDYDAAKKCLSNILNVGYRRLAIDIYWSVIEGRWTLCPVALPDSLTDDEPITSTELTSADAATLSTGNLDDIGALDSSSTTTATTSLAPTPRSPEDGSNENGYEPTVTSMPEPVLSGKLELDTEHMNSRRATLHEIGPYTCTRSLDLSTVISVIQNYFEATEDTLNAHLLYLTFNVHAAASPEKFNQPADAPTAEQLPGPHDLVGASFERAVGSYMYTPPQLESDRDNVDDSWFGVTDYAHPLEAYINTADKSGHRTSSDGWPCESYVEFVRNKRALMGWGTIDPQMLGYNFSGDAAFVFPSGTLSSFVDVTGDEEGGVESGCLYNADSTKVQSEASWAQYGIAVDNFTYPLANFSDRLETCGISPLINSTLLNLTADANIQPYKNVSLASIWSWADTEPRNTSVTDLTPTAFRCAVMDVSKFGHWRAVNCDDHYRVACRITNQPYHWVLSRDPTSYISAQDSCPEGTSFSIPHTGLENMYLYKYLLSQPSDIINASDTSQDPVLRNVWIDFNTLDVPSCWATGGTNAQCPYEIDESAVERRAVIVPTVAAVIILIVTVLTVFVKCNANRRNLRRTRVIKGWEYEGVPS